MHGERVKERVVLRADAQRGAHRVEVCGQIQAKHVDLRVGGRQTDKRKQTQTGRKQNRPDGSRADGKEADQTETDGSRPEADQTEADRSKQTRRKQTDGNREERKRGEIQKV